MKRSSKGKCYFYVYGQKDKVTYSNDNHFRAIDVLNYRKGARWPIWAQVAYQQGFNGLGLA